MNITRTEKLKLIVLANPRNNPEVSKMKVEGMDYTLRIDLEDLSRIYLKDIVTRVRQYNERITVVVNGKTSTTPEEAYENIFGYVSSVTLKDLIAESDLAYYDGTLVRDLYNVGE